jgi:hypothetical protein
MRFKSVEKRCREKMEDYQKHTTNERSEMSINLMTENMKKKEETKNPTVNYMHQVISWHFDVPNTFYILNPLN